LPKEKIDLIEKALTTVDGFSITPIKQQLGDAASFGEIRMLLASKNFEKQKSLQE